MGSAAGHYLPSRCIKSFFTFDLWLFFPVGLHLPWPLHLFHLWPLGLAHLGAPLSPPLSLAPNELLQLLQTGEATATERFAEEA